MCLSMMIHLKVWSSNRTLTTRLEDVVDITNVGPWIFLGLGVLLLLAGIYISVFQKRNIIILLIFGVLCTGLGIQGPLFMGQYAEWLRVMLAMVKTNNPETVQAVFNMIGKRDFDPALQEITLSYTLNLPIQNLDSLLTNAINSASNEQGKKVLKETKQELVAKIGTGKLLSQKLSPEEIETLDEATRILVTNELLSRTSKPDLKKGTQFSLVYREGDLETKEGICPEGSNLEWLKLFKAAISDSLKDKDGRLKLKIQGFASIAPVPVNGIINDKSDTLNLQIANERAEAVIYFLTLADNKYDQESCVAVLDSKKYAKDSTWTGTNFDVSYKPWESYDKMNKEKPLKNPPEDSKNKEDRQLDREYLNRSVRIIIE